MKRQRSSASRSSSSSRPGLEQTVARIDPPGSTPADGHDDDSASVLSRSSSGGERVRGNTQVPGSRSSHRTPGPSPKGRQTHRSTPARSQASYLACKYGVQALAKDFEATPLGPNNPPGDSTLGTLSNDRSPRPESIRPVETPGDSTLDTLSNDRSPLSESKRPVERPSSCDTGHNAG